MSAAARIGLIGGTFDPIHLGHLAAARAARDTLALDQVLFIPSHQPPHRPAQPRASAFHRFAMVSLAVDPLPRFAASDLELRRDGPSFTSDTLRALHALGYTPLQLFFIIGTDAFAEIATWHEYPVVLDLAHFVVISRPGQSLEDLGARVPALAARVCEVGPTGFAREGAAPTAAMAPGSPVAAAPCVFLVRADTPDVSSTEIRKRAAEGDSLAGLVTPEVERHIVRHRLYS